MIFACDTPGEVFLHAYQSGMRSSLFTGFLTLCGFLMSAKTFIVVNMKKEVYEKESYLLNFDTQRRLDKNLKAFTPLNELSRWLLLNVLASLTTSVFQFTVGFIPHWSAAAACLTVAAITLVILATSLFYIRANLKSMFHYLEQESEEKIKKALAERAKSQQGQQREGDSAQ